MGSIQHIQSSVNSWFKQHPLAEAGVQLGEVLLFNAGLSRLTPGLPGVLPGLGLPIATDLLNWVIFDDYNKKDLYLTLSHSIMGCISGYAGEVFGGKKAHAIGLIYGGIVSISSSILENDGMFLWKSALSNFAMVLGAHLVSGSHQFQRNKITHALKTQQEAMTVEKYLRGQIDFFHNEILNNRNFSMGYDPEIKVLHTMLRRLNSKIENSRELETKLKEMYTAIENRGNWHVGEIIKWGFGMNDEKVRKILKGQVNIEDLEWYLEEAKKYDTHSDEFYKLAKAWGDESYAEQARLSISELRRNIKKINTKVNEFNESIPRVARSTYTSAESIETPLRAVSTNITDAIIW